MDYLPRRRVPKVSAEFLGKGSGLEIPPGFGSQKTGGSPSAPEVRREKAAWPPSIALIEHGQNGGSFVRVAEFAVYRKFENRSGGPSARFQKFSHVLAVDG